MTPIRSLCVLAACGLIGCTPNQGSLGETVLPEQPTASDALGEQPVAVDGPSAPLIVDWSANFRTDLEEAMHFGVAVMAFDKSGLHLLKDCHINGKYGFIGVSTKYETVRLETADEVRANLPLGGASFVAKLGAELGHGKSLDISMALVGKRRTTWHNVAPSDLKGDCAGATHFVRGAILGAFVLATGQRGQASAAAEILGAGASGKVGARRHVHNSDGSLDACKLAVPEGTTPPGQCAALIRLELEPIQKAGADAAASTADTKEVSADRGPECPSGMVLSEGKCASAQTVKAKLCSYGDLADCTKQCGAGDAASCDNLGVMYDRGDSTTQDAQKAHGLFLKGCELGEPNACTNAAIHAYESNPREAARLAELACSSGNARGCEIAGELYHFGRGVPRDAIKATRFYAAGCNGGDQSACTNAGLMYSGGATEIPKDPALSAAYTKRACDGGVATACGNLGLKYEFGVGIPTDPKKAVELFDRACRMNPGGDCLRSAIVRQAGFGLARDEATAKALFAKACVDSSTSFGALSCQVLNLVYGESHSVPKAAVDHLDPIMQPQCQQGVPRACTFLGVSHLGSGRSTTGEMYLDAGCKAKDYWACELKRRLKL